MIRDFVKWFNNNADALSKMNPEIAAAIVNSRLMNIDDSLSAEVGSGGNKRELIISANGNAMMFSTVDSICENLLSTQWTIIALKPPRGFDFTIQMDSMIIEAKRIMFEPYDSPSLPGELGIKVICPEEYLGWFSDHVALFIESGIGERLASLIHIAGVSPAEPSNVDALQIVELEHYIVWHYGKRRGSQN